MGRFFKERLLAYVIAGVYGLLSLTWRIRVIAPTEVNEKYLSVRGPCCFAHWHGDELVLVGFYVGKNLAVLTSFSQDGTLMAKTLTLLGYQVYRGSSSKGGARGLLGLIRAVKTGSQAALAIDGPRGPIYEVKPGIVELAQRTGMPIIAARCRARPAFTFKRAWNKCYLPLPFSRVEVEFTDPIDAQMQEKMFQNDSKLIAAEIKRRLELPRKTEL